MSETRQEIKKLFQEYRECLEKIEETPTMDLFQKKEILKGKLNAIRISNERVFEEIGGEVLDELREKSLEDATSDLIDEFEKSF